MHVGWISSSNPSTANYSLGHHRISLTFGDFDQESSYSASISPEPPRSEGKSLNFGSPSFIGSTVDS